MPHSDVGGERITHKDTCVTQVEDVKTACIRILMFVAS